MKKIVLETIDGSIKNIIQLKTLDNSLEFSQMFDALEDTPRDFQTKLIDALNSLGETMQIPPTEAFNKVLCRSDDGNEGLRKKLYNWWRAFFEVLGKLTDGKMPKVRLSEYNEKIDDLMAEIMKAGDAEASTEEDTPVMEADDGDLGYQQATKKDEDKMMADMDFAVQHLGEVANKVKAVVNFINPYCERTFNEENIAKKKPGRYGIGDHVLYKGEECVVIDVDEDLRNDEEIYQVSRDSDKVDGLSFNDWVTWDEIEPAEGFVEEEEEVKKNNMKKTNETGASEFWKAMDDVDDLERKGYWSGKFKVGDKVMWNDPEYDEWTNGWTVTYAPKDADKDAIYTIENDDGSEAEVLGSELRPAKMANEVKDASDDWVSWDEMVGESDLENELDKGDDGWVEIGQPVGESKPVELESGATKKVSLYVDWDDDGAGLDSNVVIDVPAEIADSEESTALYDYITDWIDHQDFCVNDWAITDIEGLTEISENNDEVKSADVKDGEKQVTQDGETKTLVAGEEEKKEMSDAEAATIMGGASATDMDAADLGVSSHEVADPYNKKPVCEMTIEQEVDDPWKLSELLWSQGKENLEELLRSELVGEEEIMQMLEDTGVRNLTNINDLFAFDFPSVLDSLGLDGQAWSQNLEFKRKGEDSED